MTAMSVTKRLLGRFFYSFEDVSLNAPGKKAFAIKNQDFRWWVDSTIPFFPQHFQTLYNF